MIEKEKTEIYSGVKKAEMPKEDKPKKDKPLFFEDTLEQLNADGIQLKDIFTVGEMGNINLKWEQIIKIVNRHAKDKGHGTVLSWKHTFEEALSVIEVFL